MAMEKQQQCPPCKKGAPLWMATFADMATLLMAFFVLILSFSEIKRPKYEQIAGSLREAFGVQKEVKVPDDPKGISIIARSFSPALAEPTLLEQVKQKTTETEQKLLELQQKNKSHDYDLDTQKRKVEKQLQQEIATGQMEVYIEEQELVVEIKKPVSVQKQSTNQAQRNQGFVPDTMVAMYVKVARLHEEENVSIRLRDPTVRQQQEQERLRRQQEDRAQQQVDQLQVVLSKQITRGLVEVEREGTKIIVRLTEKGSFPRGDAKLNPDALPMLRALQATLQINQGKVIVSGHTDNTDTSGRSGFYSNWDLSAVRAAAVADALTTLMGVPRSRLNVAGHADTQPLVRNNSAAKRAKNRRVEVVLDVAGQQ